MRRAITITAGAIAACITAFSAGTMIVNQAGASTQTPAGFVQAGPTRVHDTRSGVKPGAGATITVSTGISGASAVGVNITMTETDGGGFVTAWASGGRPNASIINSDGAGQNRANYAIVPVNADGTFQLYTSDPTHLLVDLMGYFTIGGAPVGPGDGKITATITGYGPGSTITTVSGTATNGTSSAKDFRVDVRCPDGSVELDLFFDLAPGATKGWSVICDGAFTSGATIQAVVEI